MGKNKIAVSAVLKINNTLYIGECFMHPNRKLFFLLPLLGMVFLGCNLPTQEVIFPSGTPVAALPTETSVFILTQPPTQTLPPALTATPSSVPPTPLPTDTATAVPLPTHTLTPTFLPTVTQTPMNRQSSDAAYLASPPNMNGPWDDWNTTQYPLKFVVFKAVNWTGEEDLAAGYRVGWDGTYLYLALKVADDVYAQNESGAFMYLGDSLELLLSTTPYADSAASGLTSHSYQIGISPGREELGEDTEAYLWFPKAKEGRLKDIPIGVVSMPNGYRIEFAIPWSVFGVTPRRGDIFGFAISVSDNDDPDENLQQTMISSTKTRLLVDPSTWGLLTLK
jgi:hypothetical protein